MKLLISAIMMFFASQCIAATTPIFNEESTGGIITPDVAEGFIRYKTINYTTDGIMVVCPIYTDRSLTYRWSNDICIFEKANTSGWVYPKQAIPKGKTYVGFRAGSQGTEKYIDVYWK